MAPVGALSRGLRNAVAWHHRGQFDLGNPQRQPSTRSAGPRGHRQILGRIGEARPEGIGVLRGLAVGSAEAARSRVGIGSGKAAAPLRRCQP